MSECSQSSSHGDHGDVINSDHWRSIRQRSRRGAPWVRKYGNPSMREILVMASGMVRGRMRLRPTYIPEERHGRRGSGSRIRRSRREN